MASGFGAGLGADMLQEILQRKFREAATMRELANREAMLSEQGRQANMRHTIDQGGLELGNRRVGEDSRQFDVSSGQSQQKIDLDATEQPTRMRLLGAQAGDLEGRPMAAQQEREHDLTLAGKQHGYRIGQIRESGAQDRQTVSARTPPPTAGEPAGTYANERNSRIRQSVSEIDKKVSPWTTGVGSLLSNLPATDAANFSAELDSLKANIAFGELAEMRAASKTGGALGNVSDRELALLSSALGALDPKQSAANFREQLRKIDESLSRWEQAKSGSGSPHGAAPPKGGGFRVLGEVK
jgi:hypothetical protein